jgi:hypothetical protein
VHAWQRAASESYGGRDNGIYENIGGPPTPTSFNADLATMAEGAGCLNCVTVRQADEFDRQFRHVLDDGQMN